MRRRLLKLLQVCILAGKGVVATLPVNKKAANIFQPTLERGDAPVLRESHVQAHAGFGVAS